MFSGQRSSADEWIIQYINRKKEKEILLVTCDRKLIEECKRTNVDSIDVFKFYQILQKNLIEDVFTNLITQTSIKKYEDDIYVEDFPETINNKALDLLMEENSFRKESKKDEGEQDKQRKTKGNPRKLSKKKKKSHFRIKKLH